MLLDLAQARSVSPIVRDQKAGFHLKFDVLVPQILDVDLRTEAGPGYRSHCITGLPRS